MNYFRARNFWNTNCFLTAIISPGNFDASLIIIAVTKRNILFANQSLFALVNLFSDANFFHASKASTLEDNSTVALFTMLSTDAVSRTSDTFISSSWDGAWIVIHVIRRGRRRGNNWWSPSSVQSAQSQQENRFHLGLIGRKSSPFIPVRIIYPFSGV